MNGVNKKRQACVMAPSVEPACSLWFIDVKKKKKNQDEDAAAADSDGFKK